MSLKVGDDDDDEAIDSNVDVDEEDCFESLAAAVVCMDHGGIFDDVDPLLQLEAATSTFLSCDTAAGADSSPLPPPPKRIKLLNEEEEIVSNDVDDDDVEGLMSVMGEEDPLPFSNSTASDAVAALPEEVAVEAEVLTIIDPIRQTAARKTVHSNNQDDNSDSDGVDLLKDVAASSLPTDCSSLSSSQNSAAALKTEDSDDDDEDRLDKYLTEDLLYKVCGFLDAPDLVHGWGRTNRAYHKFCHQNQIWEFLCEQLWKNKIFCSSSSSSTDDSNPFRPQQNLLTEDDDDGSDGSAYYYTAYKQSLSDAMTRMYLYRHELVHNPLTQKGPIWSFRFKESAGIDWTNSDPWYSGNKCRQMVFLENGEMKCYNNNNNNNNGGQQQPQPQLLTDPPMRMSWRFLTRPMDLPRRDLGSYIRISVGGRDVPTYAVRRSPTNNWGFIMESCWGLYANFELPPKRNHPILRRNVIDGRSIWADGATLRPSTPADMQDDSLFLTNEVQWREAFLYNVGVRELPEGDEATVEFDRAWQGI